MSKRGRARRTPEQRVHARQARADEVRDGRAAAELERIRFWERLAAEPPAES